MRHKYDTQALVLARFAHGEANADLVLLTPAFGLIRARAQGLRKSGAKLSAALQTFSEAQVMLVRGKDAWRVSGAVLSARETLTPSARLRAGRVADLLMRLTRGEAGDRAPYALFRQFLAALPKLGEEAQDAAECLVALRLLQSLGLDAGAIPGGQDAYDAETLQQVAGNRKEYVARVNHGIAASGL